MQDKHNRFQKVRRVLADKGYYIVLLLCVAAVGVSGFFFVRTVLDTSNEQTLSIPVTVNDGTTQQKPSTDEQDKPLTTTGDTDQVPQDEQTEEPNDTTVMSDAEVREAAERVVIRPVSGETAQEYSVDKLSYNETMQDWRTHNGIDLAAEEGKAVMAAMAGTVSAVYDDDYLGTMVVIDHADGYQTVYANLKQLPTVSAGQEVNAGEVIGAVGTTALLEVGSEPHLHFEVLQNGAYVDPEEFLP